MKMARDGDHTIRLTDFSGVESDTFLAMMAANPDLDPSISLSEAIATGGGPPSAVTEITLSWLPPAPPPEGA